MNDVLGRIGPKQLHLLRDLNNQESLKAKSRKDSVSSLGSLSSEVSEEFFPSELGNENKASGNMGSYSSNDVKDSDLVIFQSSSTCLDILFSCGSGLFGL